MHICVKPLFSCQYVLKPTFTKQHIANLDKQGKLYRAYDGTTYLPGIVGLNNIKANDYANVVLQVWMIRLHQPYLERISVADVMQGGWVSAACLEYRLFPKERVVSHMVICLYTALH